MRLIIPMLAFAFTLNGFAQTENKNLNQQLQEMKGYFLAEDYQSFANYTYPKILEMMGGKANMVSATKQAMEQMKSQGFEVVGLRFKDGSKVLKHDGEMQYSLLQVMTMQTPQGKVEAEYTLIAISEDGGDNWTFMDTSNKPKATMLKYFPNLHPDIDIQPATQKMVE